MKTIFPTIIHEIYIPTFKQIENDLIKLAYHEKKKDSKGAFKSNQHGWQSQPLNPDHEFASMIMEAVKNHFVTERIYKDCVGLQLLNLWINISGKHAYNSKHDHPGSHLSGVVWVKIPPNSGRLEFEAPFSFTREKEFENYNEKVKERYNVYSMIYYNPQPGMMVIFPSDLKHEVMSNKSNEDRISISFNLKIIS